MFMGLNNTQDRDHSVCVLNNEAFIFWSSIASFYVPCVVMLGLYWRIFVAIRGRTKKALQGQAGGAGNPNSRYKLDHNNNNNNSQLLNNQQTMSTNQQLATMNPTTTCSQLNINQQQTTSNSKTCTILINQTPTPTTIDNRDGVSFVLGHHSGRHPEPESPIQRASLGDQREAANVIGKSPIVSVPPTSKPKLETRSTTGCSERDEALLTLISTRTLNLRQIETSREPDSKGQLTLISSNSMKHECMHPADGLISQMNQLVANKSNVTVNLLTNLDQNPASQVSFLASVIIIFSQSARSQELEEKQLANSSTRMDFGWQLEEEECFPGQADNKSDSKKKIRYIITSQKSSAAHEDPLTVAQRLEEPEHLAIGDRDHGPLASKCRQAMETASGLMNWLSLLLLGEHAKQILIRGAVVPSAALEFNHIFEQAHDELASCCSVADQSQSELRPKQRQQIVVCCWRDTELTRSTLVILKAVECLKSAQSWHLLSGPAGDRLTELEQADQSGGVEAPLKLIAFSLDHRAHREQEPSDTEGADSHELEMQLNLDPNSSRAAGHDADPAPPQVALMNFVMIEFAEMNDSLTCSQNDNELIERLNLTCSHCCHLAPGFVIDSSSAALETAAQEPRNWVAHTMCQSASDSYNSSDDDDDDDELDDEEGDFNHERSLTSVSSVESGSFMDESNSSSCFSCHNGSQSRPEPEAQSKRNRRESNTNQDLPAEGSPHYSSMHSAASLGQVCCASSAQLPAVLPPEARKSSDCGTTTGSRIKPHQDASHMSSSELDLALANADQEPEAALTGERAGCLHCAREAKKRGRRKQHATTNNKANPRRTSATNRAGRRNNKSESHESAKLTPKARMSNQNQPPVSDPNSRFAQKRVSIRKSIEQMLKASIPSSPFGSGSRRRHASSSSVDERRNRRHLNEGAQANSNQSNSQSHVKSNSFLEPEGAWRSRASLGLDQTKGLGSAIGLEMASESATGVSMVQKSCSLEESTNRNLNHDLAIELGTESKAKLKGIENELIRGLSINKMTPETLNSSSKANESALARRLDDSLVHLVVNNERHSSLRLSLDVEPSSARFENQFNLRIKSPGSRATSDCIERSVLSLTTNNKTSSQTNENENKIKTTATRTNNNDNALNINNNHHHDTTNITFIKKGNDKIGGLTKQKATTTATNQSTRQHPPRATLHRKRRERNAAKRERKATKTLAIVMGIFLACWSPFFTCNLIDGIHLMLYNGHFVSPEVYQFVSWIGYINSCVNPIIYTIFNMEFRRAFKKILIISCAHCAICKSNSCTC